MRGFCRYSEVFYKSKYKQNKNPRKRAVKRNFGDFLLELIGGLSSQLSKGPPDLSPKFPGNKLLGKFGGRFKSAYKTI